MFLRLALILMFLPVALCAAADAAADRDESPLAESASAAEKAPSEDQWRRLSAMKRDWNLKSRSSTIVWRVYVRKAESLIKAGDLDEAITLLESSAEHTRHFDAGDEKRWKSIKLLLKQYEASGREADEERLEEFFKAPPKRQLHREKLNSVGQVTLAGLNSRIREADYLAMEGKHHEAAAFFDRVLKDLNKRSTCRSIVVVKLVDRLTRYLYRQKRFADAETMILAQLKNHESMYERLAPTDPENLNVAFLLADLALVLGGESEYLQSEALYEEALPILKRLRGEKHPDYIVTLAAQARNHKYMGSYDKARREYRQAVSLARNNPEMGRHSRGVIMANYAKLLRKIGKNARADRVEKQATSLIGHGHGIH